MPQINEPGESQQLIAASHIFRWTSDRRTGWIPKPGREGDLLSILCGSAVPMLLHRRTMDVQSLVHPTCMGKWTVRLLRQLKAAVEPLQQIKLT